MMMKGVFPIGLFMATLVIQVNCAAVDPNLGAEVSGIDGNENGDGDGSNAGQLDCYDGSSDDTRNSRFHETEEDVIALLVNDQLRHTGNADCLWNGEASPVGTTSIWVDGFRDRCGLCSCLYNAPCHFAEWHCLQVPTVGDSCVLNSHVKIESSDGS